MRFEVAAGQVCKIDDCGKPATGGRGWCVSHYKRWVRHGDPLSGRVPNGSRQRFIDGEVLSYEGDGCLLWPFFCDPRGYGQAAYPGFKTKWAHRIVCELAHGAPPTEDHEAAHSCGNARCCSPHHLRWATVTENHADKRLHGTHQEGEAHIQAKLTPAQVIEIRRRASGGEAHGKIATAFGIAKSHVSSIKCRNRWGHIR
jgi:hypothetical protein